MNKYFVKTIELQPVVTFEESELIDVRIPLKMITLCD
jgi:hypothetical protein